MSRVDDPPALTRGRVVPSSALLSIAAIFVVYLATFLILPRDGFWINDNGCKFIQLQALVETGYTDSSIPWPGQALDPSFSCNPLPSPFGHVIDGRLYGTYSPIFPLLSSFPYRLWGFGGLYVLPLLGGLLTLPAVWSLTGFLTTSSSSRRIAQPLSLLVAALGTPMWFYSLTFWEHTPAICLTTWSVVCCMHFVVNGSVRRLALGAALGGLSVYFRDELYLFAIALAVVSISHRRRRWRSSLVFAAVFVLTLLPLWVFQWSVLGHPLGYHFRADSPFAGSMSQHLSDRWSVINLLLLNNDGNIRLSAVIAAVPLALLLLCPRVGRGAFGRTTVVCASVAALIGVTVIIRHLTAESPVWWLRHANGLFAASPMLLLAFVRPGQRTGDLPGALPAGHGEKIHRAVWLIVLAYIVPYVLLTPKLHSGGIHWGCRYLLSAFPLMSAMASGTISQWWTTCGNGARIRRAILCLTVALTVGLQVYSLTLLHRRKQFSAELNRTVTQRPEEVVLASGWFIPQELSHSFFDKKIFLIRSQRAHDRLIATLRDSGIREVLHVTWPPTRDAERNGTIVLDDGSLDFVSIELCPIRWPD